MSSSVGLLDFFVLEASDYVERLDGLLASASPMGPDPEALVRNSRTLRGSAMMARLGALAELAGGIERIGRGLRDGTLRWDPALRGVVIAAVDDVKILLRVVRTWGTAEEKRARTRIDEIAAIAPVDRTGALTPVGSGGAAYFIAQTAEIAIALEAYAAAPADRSAMANALARVRTLRGVAALKDLPPLADVIEGVERAAKPIELGEAAAGGPQRELFSAAAAVLRRAATEMRAGSRPDVTAPEVRRFAAAAAAVADVAEDPDRIVPIASLFHDDGGQHVVVEAPNPPTTPAERFRLEVVSQAEHLRRLVADARAALDVASRERLSRELQGALRALRRGADSFDERSVADFVAQVSGAVVDLDTRALAAVDDVARLLANPATRADELTRRLGDLARDRDAGDVVASAPSIDRAGAGAAPATRPHVRTSWHDQAAAGQPARPPARQPALAQTPTGRELHALLESGIASIARLDAQPLSEPVAIGDDVLVPIESLLYRGEAALARARDVRDDLRRGGDQVDREALAELFDLLDLVTAE